MSDSSAVAAAVAAVFDAATSTEASSLDGIIASIERSRGRALSIEDRDDLPQGVCGRWLATAARDVLQIQQGVPTRTWTVGHELGHLVLGHVGRPVESAIADQAEAADTALIEYMLNRDVGSADEDARQEDEAERFSGMLLARLRETGCSASPTTQARFAETLG